MGSSSGNSDIGGGICCQGTHLLSSFYSRHNGNKMYIRAYLSGDGVGFSTHLSVFFVLMRGEYDELLKWPVENKVSSILVDQILYQHIVQMFKPTPDSNSFQKPKSDMNIASGCPQFALEIHELLQLPFERNFF